MLVTLATLGPAGELAVVAAGLSAGAAAAALLWRAVQRGGEGAPEERAAAPPSGPRAPAPPPWPPAATATAMPPAAAVAAAPTPGAPERDVAEPPAAAPAGAHQALYNTEYSDQLHRLDLLRVRIATHLAAGTAEHANGHATPPAPPPDDRR